MPTNSMKHLLRCQQAFQPKKNRETQLFISEKERQARIYTGKRKDRREQRRNFSLTNALRERFKNLEIVKTSATGEIAE